MKDREDASGAIRPTKIGGVERLHPSRLQYLPAGQSGSFPPCLQQGSLSTLPYPTLTSGPRGSTRTPSPRRVIGPVPGSNLGRTGGSGVGNGGTDGRWSRVTGTEGRIETAEPKGRSQTEEGLNRRQTQTVLSQAGRPGEDRGRRGGRRRTTAPVNQEPDRPGVGGTTDGREVRRGAGPDVEAGQEAEPTPTLT